MNIPKVLCVEPSSVYLGTLVCMLRNAGYDVAVASNGEQAVSLFASQSFDGVLLEYDLPDKTGVSVRGNMKQMKPDIPVLLFAGVGPQTPILLRFFGAYISQERSLDKSAA